MGINPIQHNLNMDITDKPTFEVHVPISNYIIWPNSCSLCNAPIVEQRKTISHEVLTGEYLIAEIYKNYKINDIPYCNNCYKKTSLTKAEQYSIVMSIIIGAILAGIILIISINFLCIAAVIFAAVFILSLINFQFFIKNKSEMDSIDFEFIMDPKILGKQNPIALKIRFRNRIFAQSFAKINNLFGQHICNQCNSYLLLNYEKSNWYCINCNNY